MTAQNARRAARALDAKMILGRENFLRLTRQMNNTYVKLDETLAHTLRMTADMIDTAQQIGLEPERGQKLFKRLAKCSDSMMATRDDVIAAHLEATRIRMRTDQAETADGCYPYPYGQVEEKLRVVASKAA